MSAVEQEFDGEARRIAAGLVRLHKDGAIASQADAMFYARLLCDFGATYLGPVEAAPAGRWTGAPMCRLPCSSFASLAGSPGKGGSVFCRRTLGDQFL